MKLLVLSLVLNIIGSGECAKILGVFTWGAGSHYILGNALLKGLAEKGHDVTMISPFEEKNPPKNGSYKDNVLTGFREEYQETSKRLLEVYAQSLVPRLIRYNQRMIDRAERTLNHSSVQKLLQSEEKFDVVIVEQFMNEALKVLAGHYDVPLIVLSTLGANPWINFLAGNPSPPSYISDVFLSYSSDMTFYERHAKLAKKYCPHAPPLEDIMYNTSIFLMNAHPSVNQPVPYVPNMIDIGGFHIQRPKKLPKDLQEFLDEAKEGVIYFSMGTNIKSVYLPNEKRDAILKTFAQLKEKVLWKWEEDVLPGQPPNVKLGKWLPQQDILAHPNVKLFITHAGLLSTLETIYHGIPVLAIPVIGDQTWNARRMENQGYGVMLEYEKLSEELFTEKLKEVLENPKYKMNAKERSRYFHDRPITPLDTATYWVEYVIRHRGSPHLRVAGTDMPLYKYLLLDVAAFVGAVCLTALVVFYLLMKTVINKFCTKPKQQKVKKN